MTDNDAPDINPSIVDVLVIRLDRGEVPPAGSYLMQSKSWPDGIAIELWVRPKGRKHENATLL